MNIRKREKAAYHEAGHIVTLYLLTGNIDRIESVQITIGNNETDGYCQHREIYKNSFDYDYNNVIPPEYDTIEGFQFIFNEVCYSIAGGVAEMIGCKLKRLPRLGMAGDFEKIYSDWFINTHYIPCHINSKNEICYPVLDTLVKTAVDFITSLFKNPLNWILIENVALELMKHDVLNQEEIYELLRRK